MVILCDIVEVFINMLMFSCVALSLLLCFTVVNLVRRWGYRKLVGILCIFEATMIIILFFQLWFVLFPPFVYYTWNRGGAEEVLFLFDAIRCGFLF